MILDRWGAAEGVRNYEEVGTEEQARQEMVLEVRAVNERAEYAYMITSLDKGCAYGSLGGTLPCLLRLF